MLEVRGCGGDPGQDVERTGGAPAAAALHPPARHPGRVSRGEDTPEDR